MKATLDDQPDFHRRGVMKQFVVTLAAILVAAFIIYAVKSTNDERESIAKHTREMEADSRKFERDMRLQTARIGVPSDKVDAIFASPRPSLSPAPVD